MTRTPSVVHYLILPQNPTCRHRRGRGCQISGTVIRETSHGSGCLNVLWTMSSDCSCRELRGRHWRLRRNISGDGSLASGDSEPSTPTWKLKGTERSQVCVLWTFQVCALGSSGCCQIDVRVLRGILWRKKCSDVATDQKRDLRVQVSLASIPKSGGYVESAATSLWVDGHLNFHDVVPDVGRERNSVPKVPAVL